ncbi:hypothetical protein N9889_01480 [bacterium]|nr:hypothetical protein [bacterium]MDB4266268.1 hypothetical protein [bacterium]MDB4314004.1 hypothetical protein [Akkermansiaceae bacterium]MDB4425682.1 hypothetical protein [bacterium]MDB4554185.1 hypothetical protein [Akkermansiaceae bacterium]
MNEPTDFIVKELQDDFRFSNSPLSFAMIFRLFSLGLLAGLFCSCGSVSNIAALSKEKYKELRRPTPPIVEIKKGALTELKSGEEQILAYNSLLKRGRYSGQPSAVGEFFAPDDFDAGALPTSVNFPSLGLLPPLKFGGNSSIETDKSIESLNTKPKASEIAPTGFSSQ